MLIILEGILIVALFEEMKGGQEYEIRFMIHDL
jgi:hypothetical protein